MSDNRRLRPCGPGRDPARAAAPPHPAAGRHIDAGLPAVIKSLPRCPVKGAPIPFSSGTDDQGAGRFGINDPMATMICVIGGLCGICGTKLDGEAAFLVIDTRPVDPAVLIFADPPNHESCAEWAMRLCPFISRPDGVRSDGTGKPGWLIVVAGSWSPVPPPPGSKGLVGFIPGPVERIRAFAYDERGKLTETTKPPRLVSTARNQPRRRPRSRR
jgi:hypothetical protein